jgi:hypothetical protein
MIQARVAILDELDRTHVNHDSTCIIAIEIQES